MDMTFLLVMNYLFEEGLNDCTVLLCLDGYDLLAGDAGGLGAADAGGLGWGGGPGGGGG